MKCDVATTVDVVDLCVRARDRLAIYQEIGGVPVSANGEYRWMLEEEEIVIGCPTFDASLM